MPKVLIVAPEDVAPEFKQTLLWRRNVERVFVSSPALALEVARSFVPSLVVIDAADDAGTATGLIQRLRESPGTRRSSIVVRCSSPGGEEALRRAGANLALPGPVDARLWDSHLEILLNVPRRLKTRFEVRFQRAASFGPSEDGLDAVALDLSVRGMLLETLATLMPDDPVALCFTLPGRAEPICVTGTVVRIAPGGTGMRCGVRFVTLQADAGERIHGFMESVAPERLFGRYEVQGLLGEGSMGRVYRGFDPLARRPVAIKTLRPECLAGDSGDEARRRFRREAQAAAMLIHPHIVTIFDVGEDYFVMELLDGATLQATLADRGRLEPREALSVLAPVADALDYAHAEGTIHRDVKPANIMVLPDGRPKMMDFGVAHLTSAAITARGQSFGSPAYMAPEQVKRSQVTAFTDLFSLAIVAYETLTGAKPFEGQSITPILYHVVNTDPMPPTSANPSLPEAYDAIFRRALEKDPFARFPSARAFVAALAHEVGATLAPVTWRASTAPNVPPPRAVEATLELGTEHDPKENGPHKHDG